MRLPLIVLLPIAAIVAAPAGASLAGRPAAEHVRVSRSVLAARTPGKQKPYKTRRIRLPSLVLDLAKQHLPFIRTSRPIPYFSAHDRKAYEITVREGRLYFRGELLNTAHPVRGVVKDTFNFVMAADGTLYGAPEGGNAQDIRHSSFTAGAPTAAAGTIIAVDGIVQVVTNDSGHYKPPAATVRQVLTELERRGVATDAIEARVTTGDKLSTKVRSFVRRIGRRIGGDAGRPRKPAPHSLSAHIPQG